ncbi:MAG: o-succinylbenzoate synthase [Candidatus Omnitrophica bacterium]|nr:o-succinylbenzoate synthase [Candidatus Omnitrophota bacterium]
MKIASFRVYQYALDLKQPIWVHGVQMSRREGFVIRLTSEQETGGFGEVVPLKGWSEESLDEAREQIRAIRAKLVDRDIPPGVEKLEGKMRSWLPADEMNLRPSVQFGMEMAVLNLIANARNTRLFQPVAHAGYHDHVRVSALLDGTREEVQRQAREFKEEGFKDMKLKVRGPVDESAAKVKAVNDVLRGEVLLHLDANQAWELDEAVRFGREIECGAAAYIEEPLKHVYQTPEFYQETMIPVALDESLGKLSFDELKSMDGVDVLVLKPTVLGGIEKTWQFMQEAQALGLSALISSSFESGLGILTLANLAGCTVRDQAAGLDTLKWFRQDLLKEKVSIRHGKIDVRRRLPREEDIDFSLLQEIL